MRLTPLLACVFPAAIACAGGIYITDTRFVQSQTSFAQNEVKQPATPFSPFNNSATSSTTNAAGSCSGTANQNSSLSSVSMTGSGSAQSEAAAIATSGLVYGASGSSSFAVKLKFPVRTNLSFSGQLDGSALRSNVLASLQVNNSPWPLFRKETTGSFSFEAAIPPNAELLVTVSGSCNAFAVYSNTPVMSSGSASFSFQFGASPACPGDLNSDGFVDDADFSIFILAYNILDCADPAMPAGCPSDLNNDQLVDDADFSIFVVAYDALLCP